MGGGTIAFAAAPIYPRLYAGDYGFRVNGMFARAPALPQMPADKTMRRTPKRARKHTAKKARQKKQTASANNNGINPMRRKCLDTKARWRRGMARFVVVARKH